MNEFSGQLYRFFLVLDAPRPPSPLASQKAAAGTFFFVLHICWNQNSIFKSWWSCSWPKKKKMRKMNTIPDVCSSSHSTPPPTHKWACLRVSTRRVSGERHLYLPGGRGTTVARLIFTRRRERSDDRPPGRPPRWVHLPATTRLLPHRGCVVFGGVPERTPAAADPPSRAHCSAHYWATSSLDAAPVRLRSEKKALFLRVHYLCPRAFSVPWVF